MRFTIFKSSGLAAIPLIGALAVTGCDLARLQDGLETPSIGFVQQVNDSEVFQAPRAITGYDTFDVPVEEDLRVRVHAREAPGARANILLIHGAGGGAWVWEEFFETMPRSYNLYALSWRGHFDSTPVANADSAAYVRDQIAVLAAIAQRNNLPVHVVGHSYGGATAVLMAADPRVEIASLHLLASVAPLDYSTTQRLLVPVIAPAFIKSENEADGVFGSMFLSEARMQHYFQRYAGQDFSDEKRGLIAKDGVSPGWQAQLAESYRTVGVRGIPTQIMIARYDNVVVPRRQRGAAALANASVVAFESGHYLPLDRQTDQVMLAITAELDRLE